MQYVHMYCSTSEGLQVFLGGFFWNEHEDQILGKVVTK